MSSIGTVNSSGGGGGVGNVKFLTGNSGGPVGPDGIGNINVVGDGTTITVADNPGTNTLTISTVGSAGITLTGDTGGPLGPSSSFTFDAVSQAGSSVSFSGSATKISLNTSDFQGNTIIGLAAGNGMISGESNVGMGVQALKNLTSGGFNTAVGYLTALNLTTGQENVIYGYNAGGSLTTGSNNTLIGYQAGTSYNSGENYNIILGPSGGTNGISGEMWLGDFTHGATTYIAGVSGVTVSNINAVTINTSTGQLGSEAFPASGIATLDGDTGSATGSTITFTAHANNQYFPSFAASGSTVDLNFEDGNTNIILGNLNTGFVPSGSSNIGIGHIVYNDNASSTLSGNGNTALNYGALGSLTSGSNNTGIGFQALTVLGTGSRNIGIGGLAQVGNQYVGGESDNILINSFGVASENNTLRIGSGTGTSAGQLNASFIAGINSHAQSYNTAGINVVTINSSGDQLGIRPITDANNNILIGLGSDSPTTGNYNVAMGVNCLTSLTTGAENIGFGFGAGFNYASAESSNILFNNFGVVGESNTLRIGASTGTGSQQLDAAYIAGIQGITVTGAAVLVSASDQLGIAVSSRKFKDNIRDMDNYSSAILNLRPTVFNYKGSTETSSGLIAEEVEEIMPDLVVYDKAGDAQTVKYHDLPALLLNELQKALKRIEALEAKLGV